MKQFWLKLIVFILPFAIVMAPAVGILLSSGEFVSYRAMIARQIQNSDIVYGPAFSNPVLSYKLESTLLRKPAVLILGTSRVMEIRSAAFLAPDKVYNAGGGVALLWHYKKFLDKIPEAQQPELILAGLDPWEFNDNWEPRLFETRYDIYKPPTDDALRLISQSYLPIMKSWRQGRFTVSEAAAWTSQTERVGLAARVDGTGFRSDGSHINGTLPGSASTRIADSLARIRDGNNRFEYGHAVSETRINILREFLTSCQARKIHVVAFLPPFADEVVNAMKARESDYVHVFELYSKLKPIFDEYGFTLIDCTQLGDFGALPDEIEDGFHGNEKAYWRIVKKLSESDLNLRKWIALEKVRQAIE